MKRRAALVARTPAIATGPFRTVLDVAPVKPRVGEPADLIVRVTTSSGAPPRKPLEDPRFSIVGGGEPGGGAVQVPAFSETDGILSGELHVPRRR